MSKTTRLLIPSWQGGNNPNYVFGAELLAQIVPQSQKDDLIRIDVATDFATPLEIEAGVKGAGQLKAQMETTRAVLEAEKPDKVIILGGDCSVSQVPFDYLSGKYQDKLGIIWLDAHPDVATIDKVSHLHEMVLTNLLGVGSGEFSTYVQHPIHENKVLLAGLIPEALREIDKNVSVLGLKYLAPEELVTNMDIVGMWLQEQGIKYVAIHFDLDVLSPADFRSIYPAEPYIDGFRAAIGKLKLSDVSAFMEEVSTNAEIVGLTIAEHLPWDAFNLRKTLAGISIFQEDEA